MKISKKIFDTFKQALKLKTKERIGIIFDFNYSSLVQQLSRIFFDNQIECILKKIEPLEKPGQLLGKEIDDWMKDFSALIFLTKNSPTHSKETQEAAKLGKKIITMPGILLESFSKGAMTVSLNETQELTKILIEKIEKFREFLVITNDNVIKIIRGSRAIYGIEGDALQYPMNLPDGEAFFAPLEGKSFGQFNADFFGPFGEDLRFTIKNGKLDKIEGFVNKGFLRIIKRNSLARNVAEFGIGTNRKALKVNNILEAEKILGSVHIGFGTNVSLGGNIETDFHMDAIILKPTVYGLDDQGKKHPIIRKGLPLFI